MEKPLPQQVRIPYKRISSPADGGGFYVRFLSSRILPQEYTDIEYKERNLKMCIAAMKSMTSAQKGKNVLAAMGVYCEIVNLDPMMTENGCAYGLSFPRLGADEVARLLNRKKIAHGEILGGRL